MHSAGTVSMSQNVGSVDRVLRTTVGAVAGIASLVTLVGAVSLPTVLSPVLGVFAMILLVTATVGTCPVYSVLGIDSCSRTSSPS